MQLQLTDEEARYLVKLLQREKQSRDRSNIRLNTDADLHLPAIINRLDRHSATQEWDR